MKTQSITKEGIVGYNLTEEEFGVLKYLDSRIFVDSAIERFTGWHSSFDSNHPDWKDRVEVQRALARSISAAIELNLDRLKKLPKIKIIFLGASLGSIATFFTLRYFKHHKLLDKVDLTIYDLLLEPLERTKCGDFDMSVNAIEDCGNPQNINENEYKKCLSTANICAGNITDIQLPDDEYDFTIAPFVQHHLNIYDKQKSCQEMQRITAENGFIGIGDLCFNHEQFNIWLKRHKEEKVSYAMESFISLEEHISIFKHADVIDKRSGDFYYVFCMS